ncbi:class I SAM-dependent methyltransferase [Granulicella rosea]|nr:class I SAM-dependent methyltransferase [Granulicella rosea]
MSQTTAAAPNKTQAVFDATASTYDNDRARLIPGCDAFYRWALELIPVRAKTIVDLGAGSGLLTRLLRDRFPTAHIHVIDFSAPMLDKARERMAGDANITFHQVDYSATPLPEGLCAVASSLSIHHLDDAGKRALFSRIHAALKPRGVFVNADQISGPTPELEERYKALWLKQVRELGATEPQIEASLFRQQEDRCAPVQTQLDWMREAGFADANCWYKDNRFAVMAGTR